MKILLKNVGRSIQIVSGDNFYAKTKKTKKAKQSKKSIKVNEIEQLSDDFHVVIKFKTQPSKAKFKEFVDLMSHLRNNSNFNLDIEMFNDEFVTDSSDINQQTLNAISKIASNSAIHTIEVVKK